ncbi:MAG: 5'/3'-nucleotidase SurE [Pseudomonadota bacterium]
MTEPQPRADLAELRERRILVTNDDGFGAPGIRILERIARRLSGDVWVVAPEVEQSGMGHALTVRRPLRPKRASPDDPTRWIVDGTPTDCMIVAIRRLMADEPPDLVLSGVNRGHNLGEDVTYSGTVAAAMEATLLGVPAIAFSQAYDGPIDWTPTETHLEDVVLRLCRAPWPADVLMNVNFPAGGSDAVKGLVATRQGRRVGHVEVRDFEDPKGRDFVWIGDFEDHGAVDAGSDLEAIADGMISVTPIHLDLTHAETLRALRAGI